MATKKKETPKIVHRQEVTNSAEHATPTLSEIERVKSEYKQKMHLLRKTARKEASAALYGRASGAIESLLATVPEVILEASGRTLKRLSVIATGYTDEKGEYHFNIDKCIVKTVRVVESEDAEAA